MRVKLKRSNGWTASRKNVDNLGEIKYARVDLNNYKHVTVLIRGEDDFVCSMCDEAPHRGEGGTCQHARAVADMVRGIPA